MWTTSDKTEVCQFDGSESCPDKIPVKCIEAERLLSVEEMLSTTGQNRYAQALNGSRKAKPTKPTTKGAPTVTIIGAGMSGSSAANALVAAGYTVTIVEARNRIGGRTWTDRKSLSKPVDLGAGWIHEADGNPITDLCKKYKIKTTPTDYENAVLYGTDGKEVTDAVSGLADKTYKDIMAKVATMANSATTDMSVGAAITKVTSSMKLTAQQQLFLTYSEHVSLEHEYAGDISTLSLMTYDEGEEFDGEDELVIGGYDGIVSGLLSGLKIDLKLSNVVSSIDYSAASGVTVKMTNGSSLTSDYVVCTIPLGVLQSGSVKFTPALPAAKLTAMSHLKMGLLNKLFLEFPSVFWDKEAEVLGHVSDTKGLWQESYNLYYYTKKPILLMFTAANFAKDMETWTDAAIVASAMTTLRLIYGKSVPDPTKQVITRWGQDPYSLGSYSYSGVGSNEPTDRLALAATVADRLFFGGEATSDLYPATNHGAYLSG